MNNIYDTEAIIKKELLPLFDEKLIFTQVAVDDIESHIFDDIDDVDDRAACLIIYGGFKTKGDSTGSSKQQIIQPLWRVITITPSELYHSHCGGKMIDVINTLKGCTLGDTCKGMVLTDDVREFNEPSYINSLVGLPSVFSFDVIV
jgi:hypothetical protein